MRYLASLIVCVSFLGVVVVCSAQANQVEYGLESVDASVSTSQAGAHPDITVSFSMKTEANGTLPATSRDISVALPPGLLADPSALPKCNAAELTATDVEDKSNVAGCPQDAQVGITEVLLFKGDTAIAFTEPVYNMVAPGGDAVARLGFMAYIYPVFIDGHLRSDDDYGVTVTVQGASSLIPLLSASTTIWGVPAAESHDAQRITPYESINSNGVPQTLTGKRQSGLVPAPFTINPTDCGGMLQVKVTAKSYAQPDQPSESNAWLPPVTGCGQLTFEPTMSVVPTASAAASPSGLNVDLALPQDETVGGLATSQIEEARVSLPKGMTVAAGVADGLRACSAAEAGYMSAGTVAHCADAAKLATAEIDVPVLERPLRGAVYQRSPTEGDLFRIWLIADDLGAHVVLPGVLKIDRQDGRIASAFVDLPRAPLRELVFHFFGGPRGPLATPRHCGSYSTRYELTPYSGGIPLAGDAPMEIDHGCDTGGFDPQLGGGAANPLAGAFSAFVTKLTRESGEQDIAGLSITPPAGVLAKLAGVPLCEGPDTQTGECPTATRIGAITVSSGPGPNPLWLPQPGKTPTAVYLSGPYRGAPYSLVIKIPAQAGPFDLGTVVNRAAVYVDPVTLRLTVRSDPLPQFLEGVPASLRTVHVDINRPNFTLTPTNCRVGGIESELRSTQGAVARPSERFEVGGCRGLGFGPRVSLRLRGGTSRGSFPVLRAVYRARSGDSNLRRIVLRLPHSEFIEQGHFRTICTRVQYAAHACPKGSIYGHIRVFTPLLSQPLKGPVYLRSSNHELPDIVFALHGKVDAEVTVRIDSVHGRLRATIANAPDVMLDKVVLNMQGGHKGLVVNSTDICRERHRAEVKFVGHNGRNLSRHPVLRGACRRSRHPATKRHW